MIVQTFEKGQKQPSSHSCTELSKTQFFPVSIVKKTMLNKVKNSGKSNARSLAKIIKAKHVYI